MAIFALVHGASHGGWCWQRVTPLLRAAGHEVFTPTLTGLGERVHLASPAIGLETHILDIVNVLVYEDLHDVLLVGHSYGGVITTAVAHRVPERLARLIYLDAPVPDDGQTAWDLLDASSRAAADARTSAATSWRTAPGPLERIGITEQADRRWVEPRLVAQPRRPSLEPVRLGNTAASELPKTYIFCRQTPKDFPSAIFKRRLQATGVPYQELEAGHDAMVTAPRPLAAMLLDLA